MPHDKKRQCQPPPDIIAMLDRGLEPALIELNKPPEGICKLLMLHFGEQLYKRLRTLKEDKS